MNNENENPIVYFTGAGPGDPNLLTLRAKEIIESCDVIVYDHLVSKEILDFVVGARLTASLQIYAGRVGYKPEESINIKEVCDLLLDLSRKYKKICRLKGGDPNVFGRLGEEAVFLKEHKIDFEIIPGVSSITAVPAYAGIPLTHRDAASSFVVLTAQGDPENDEDRIRWENFDALNSTLVILMGTKKLPKIINKLIELGRDKNTPLAVIHWGTTSNQKTFVTTLGNAVCRTEVTSLLQEVKPPSIIVIGTVVNYREILNWYETKSLFGKKILITRSKEQSVSFASKLIKEGAKPILCPIVNYKLNEKEIYNKKIVNNISSYNWIFFTSQNAVRFFFEILKKNCFDSRALSGTKIATVGYKTKSELLKYNINSDFTPKKFSFNDLIRELSEIEDLESKSILYPTQVETCHGMSLQTITTWPIYTANFAENLDDTIINQIKSGVDIVTFFSSNTVEYFAKLLQKYDLQKDINNALLAVIGDETAKTTKELFGKVDIIGDEYTEDGLINAIKNHYEKSFKIPSTTPS